VPFGQDGSYSHEAIVTRINADLANDLGNLAQRCLAMVAKNCGGVLPAPGAFTENDRAILDRAMALSEKSRAAMADYSLHVILTEIWRIVGDANRYFASEEPWAMRKSAPERMHTILYVTAEVLRIVAIMTQPFMPLSAGKLLDLLGVQGNARNFASAESTAGLSPGTQLPAPAPVFPRYIPSEEDSSREASGADR
jgi:methionyl-tRNA synthetase